jgi:uncharacterized protein DUF6515
MRFLVLSLGLLFTACFGATCAIAQTGQWGQAEDQNLPYRTHMDRRHGHDHVYPDRGAVVRDAPRGAAAVNYAGLSFVFAGGVWYERLGPAYIVVDPPIGVVVPQLPAFVTSFDSAGKTYLYSNDVFYRPRPDLGGYEVVNDPEDVAPERAQASAGASPSRMASAAPSAAQPPVQSPPLPESTPVTQAMPAATPSSESSPPANPTGVAIHPRNGQDLDQQARDRYACYRFAVAQTGFDPLAPNGASPADTARGTSEYSRAQTACLEGRGYSVP